MCKWGDMRGEAGEVSKGQTIQVSRLRNGVAIMHTEKDFSKGSDRPR